MIEDFVLSGERAALGPLHRDHLPSFAMLGLHNVMLETYGFNEQARRAYERAGFRLIGRRRDAVQVLGRRWDSFLMDATAADFESPVLARFRPD